MASLAALALAAATLLLPYAGNAATMPAAADATDELLAAVNALRADSGLAPLHAEPALASVAARTAESALAGGFDSAGAADPMELSRQIRRAGYQFHEWRRRVVAGPGDAAAMLQHWRESDPTTFAEVVLGDFEGLGGARSAAEGEPPLWALYVALPRITSERRLAAPLDDTAAVEATILAEVNAARAAAGLGPLALEARLGRAALDHARDMLGRRYYDHLTPEGDGPGQRAEAAGYRWRWVAENIAKGLFPHDEVVDRWLGSTGHRRNILDPRARQAGIGVVWGEDRDGHVVALWVLLLAAPG